MKKVIIISEFFAPQNNIAAIRFTKVAKYLHNKHDCEITVVTRDVDFKALDIKDDLLGGDSQIINKYIKISEGEIIRRINELRNRRVSTKIKKNGSNLHEQIPIVKRNKLKNVLLNTGRQILEVMNNYSYYRRAVKILRSSDVNYDAIISSYGPLSSHLIGKYLKCFSPSSTWIADFRDPVYNLDTSFGLRSFMKKFARFVCKKADYITTVSEGCMNNLFIPEWDNKYIITNGYDKDDLKSLSNVENRHSQFNIVYTGTLYKGKSDLTPVFRAVQELINEGLLHKEDLEFKYVGNSEQEFLHQISRFKLDNIASIHGVVERKESLFLQRNSDLLLLASWNNQDSNGIVTGKFYEYIMMEKPIICIVSGDLPNSILKQMIAAAGIGYTYEEANKEMDFETLKEFIFSQYMYFKENRTPVLKINTEYTKQFSYEHIAGRFAKLLNG